MHPEDSLLRLEILVVLCQQLPQDAAEDLLLRAIDDPDRFNAEALSLHSAGQVHLAPSHVDLLTRDLGLLQVAV